MRGVLKCVMPSIIVIFGKRNERMKWNKFIWAALSILFVGCESGSSENGGRSEDIAEIKSNAKAYEEAYNSHNAEKVASFWATNAVYIVPDSGDTINGRPAIAEYFKDLFKNEENHIKIDVVVDNVDFKGSDHAIEKGHVFITYADGSEDETAYQAENIKENGKWFLQTVREVEIGKAISNYEQLKGLDWLVGKWEDTDEDSDIELNFQWGKNKNFLIEHFIVKVMDRDEMEGIQIIGWDPSRKKIRSWVFDSDGGLRDGTWSKEGKNWVAVMKSTLSDGKKGSSIDIYTPVDDENFTFAMDSRDVDGDILPDVGPVNFKKKKME